MQLALAARPDGLGGRFRLPPAVPPFNTATYRLFTVIWVATFLLALTGPLVGFYQRYTAPENNSQLLLGSRAGFAVSPEDATSIRFAVGKQATAAGIKPGDDITAIYGLPLPDVMPVTEEALSEHQDDPAYIAMSNLLFATEASEVPITISGRDGRTREIIVQTSEDHIETAAQRLGVTAKVLSFVDLLHVISYPFLLWAAWLLHRRNARDAVSSILSLAILLTISAEQPSSTFLASIGVSRWVNVAIFDLGNVLLLAGIMLFPHGTLSWRKVVLIACLPFLMLTQGSLYQTLFVGFMTLAVLALLRCLRRTESTDQRQQIRWALLGISTYAVLRCLSIIGDYLKWSADSFALQLIIELTAGVTFALAVIFLQLGLLVALIRYRLYDAEVVISRTVSVAIVTLVISGGFAAVMEGIITGLQFLYPESESSQMLAAMAGAIFAASCLEPVRDRVRNWTERRFEKNLFLLREDLPELVRDLRQTATLEEMIDSILTQVDKGVRAVRSAAIVNGRVYRTRGITVEEVESWRTSKFAEDYKSDICEQSDGVFPIRVPLVPSSGDDEPVGFLLVGPRPDRSVPSRAEQKALAGMAETVARAIRTVIRREVREQVVLDRITANTRRIEKLEALLAATVPMAPKRTPRAG